MLPTGMELTLRALHQPSAAGHVWRPESVLRVRRVGGQLDTVVDELAREILASTGGHVPIVGGRGSRGLLLRVRVEEPNARGRFVNWVLSLWGDRRFTLATLAGRVDFHIECNERDRMRTREAQRWAEERRSRREALIAGLDQWVAETEGTEVEARGRLARDWRACILEGGRSLLSLSSPILRSLPSEIGNLARFKALEFRNCFSLIELPESLSQLSCVESFHLERCSKLRRLPENLAFLQHVHDLSVSECPELPDAELERLLAVVTLWEPKKVLRDELQHRAIQRAMQEGLALWVEQSPAGELQARRQVAAMLPSQIKKNHVVLIYFTQLPGGNRVSTLPDCLSGLQDLRVLNCRGGRLRRLPDWIGSLKGLWTLDVSGNPIEKLPDALGDCAGLMYLHLKDTRIRHLPESVGRLHGLITLDVAGTPLVDLEQVWCEGQVVTQAGLLDGLTQLTRLELQHSQIRRLPESIGQLKRLQHLNCSHAPLTALPESLNQLSALVSLDCAHTPLHALPSGLDQLTWLKQVCLNGCYNLRDLPQPVGPPKLLKALDLSQTGLTQVPAWMGQMRELRRLSLFHTSISALPRQMARLQKLELLDLGHTNLAGRMPDWLSNLSELKTLRLCQTQIESLPDLQGLYRLQTLDLSLTPITTLPRSIKHLRSLERLDLAGCRSLTLLPPQLFQCRSLRSLQLGSCRGLPTADLIRLREWAGEFCPESVQGILDEIERHQLFERLLCWTTQTRGYSHATNRVQQDARRELIERWMDESLFPLQWQVLSLREWAGGPLVDSLPEAIHAMSGLRRLDLCGGQIVELPSALLDLPNLSEIDVQDPRAFAMLNAQSVSILLQFVSRRTQEHPVGRVLVPPSDRNQSAETVLSTRLAQLQAAGAVPSNTLALIREDVERIPRHILARLAQLLQRQDAGLRVRFIAEAGADAGGLRKELWTLLGRHLFSDHRADDHSHLPAVQAPSTEDHPEGEGWFPRASTALHNESAQQLGRVVSWGARQDPPLHFPAVLDSRVWVALHSACQQADQMVVLSEALDAPYLRLLLRDVRERLDEEEWAVLIALADDHFAAPSKWLQLSGEAEKRNYLSKAPHRLELREAVVATHRPLLDFLDQLLEGIRLDRGSLAAVCPLSPPELMDYFMGRVDPDSVAERCVCTANPDAPQLVWLKQWVKKASSAELRHFLRMVTGKEGLGTQEQIKLILDEDPQAVQVKFATCFNWLRMPLAQVQSEGEFLSLLEWALQTEELRFGMA